MHIDKWMKKEKVGRKGAPLNYWVVLYKCLIRITIIKRNCWTGSLLILMFPLLFLCPRSELKTKWRKLSDWWRADNYNGLICLHVPSGIYEGTMTVNWHFTLFRVLQNVCWVLMKAYYWSDRQREIQRDRLRQTISHWHTETKNGKLRQMLSISELSSDSEPLLTYKTSRFVTWPLMKVCWCFQTSAASSPRQPPGIGCSRPMCSPEETTHPEQYCWNGSTQPTGPERSKEQEQQQQTKDRNQALGKSNNTTCHQQFV